MIVQVSIVLNRTVVWCFDNLSSSHLQSQSELHHIDQLMVLISGCWADWSIKSQYLMFIFINIIIIRLLITPYVN